MESQPGETTSHSAAFSIGLTLCESQAIKPPLRAGDLCPTCQHEKLDYDGLLNLACPSCGSVLGGCFT